MMYAFIRWWATIFLRLYFRKTIVYNRNYVPRTGPLILASNHPSAFLEASMLTTVMMRPIHFMVRGDMFHPRFKWLFKWTKQIPIYRKKDGIANLRKNAASFDYTYKILSEGESVLIFPEAKTVLEKKMRPIQRGTAHLAFGTMPLIKEGEQLMIQPVGVNFTEPRYPGTDVVVQFGKPFATENASREDRDAIESFTQKLSEAMDPLIIQVNEEREKDYDVLASIYFRLLYDNHSNRDAHADLKNIAQRINDDDANPPLLNHSGQIRKELIKHKTEETVYFPDLIMFNKMGLSMLLFLKIIWLIAGGWIWRLVRSTIFKKIKSNTFQAPTSVGVIMVVIPVVTFILLIVFLVVGVPWYFALIWLFILWLGRFIRPPFPVILRMLSMPSSVKSNLKLSVLYLRNEVSTLIQ